MDRVFILLKTIKSIQLSVNQYLTSLFIINSNKCFNFMILGLFIYLYLYM